MVIEITYKKLLNEVIPALNQIDVEIPDKVTKNAKKIAKQIIPLVEKYNERITDINETHAGVDAKGYLIENEDKTFKYTPEKSKLRRSEIKSLQDEIVILDSRIVTTEDNKRDNLSLHIIESLADILFENVEETE